MKVEERNSLDDFCHAQVKRIRRFTNHRIKEYEALLFDHYRDGSPLLLTRRGHTFGGCQERLGLNLLLNGLE